MMPDNTEVGVNGGSEPTAEETTTVIEEEHDPHFVPIVYLPEVHIPTLEEHEDEMIKLRAKLFRFDSSSEPPEWKERGAGEIKLMLHKERSTVRVVMRRDKTLKICANHLVASWMQLKPNCGSDRAWVWSVSADYADEEPKSELLAARFANADDAKKWFDTFEEAKKISVNAVTKPAEFEDAESSDESEAEDDSGLGDKSEPSPKEQASKETDKETEGLADELSKVKVDDKGDTA